MHGQKRENDQEHHEKPENARSNDYVEGLKKVTLTFLVFDVFFLESFFNLRANGLDTEHKRVYILLGSLAQGIQRGKPKALYIWRDPARDARS